MKNFKNLALILSISALTATLPYTAYNTQALPINDINEKEINTPLDIFNLENKNTKRNQKEEMVEILVNLYNKYNKIFKKGIEINDVKNSDLYFNITKQKSEIKGLLNEIINYPYSVVNSKIEQDFLKSNILFCYLSNQYIKTKNLDKISNYDTIDDVKNELIDIFEILSHSSTAIENLEGNYSNIPLNETMLKLNKVINNIYDLDSFKINFQDLIETLDKTCSEINSVVQKYIHI